MKNISNHITFEEATKSQSAIRAKIDNKPNEIQLANMRITSEKCFEPIREWYGKPLIVSSFFRCKALNTLIKGSKTSQHMEGKAIDVSTNDPIENKKIFEWCKANLKFDQLINEFNYSWIHISYNEDKNRNQVLIKK
mgnify:CR=1 FL=1